MRYLLIHYRRFERSCWSHSTSFHLAALLCGCW